MIASVAHPDDQGLPGEGFHGQLVVLPDAAVPAEDEEDAGGPGDLAAGVCQLDGEGDDAVMAGHVAGRSDGVPAAGHELLVGMGDPGVEFLVPPELGALHELGAIGCPQVGDGGAAGPGVGLAPHRHIVRDDIGRPRFGDLRHGLRSFPSAGAADMAMLGAAAGEGSSRIAGEDSPPTAAWIMSGVPGYLSIGDFSRATHMTVRTLRHYHQIGLLEPAEVDPHTGQLAGLPDAQRMTGNRQRTLLSGHSGPSCRSRAGWRCGWPGRDRAITWRAWSLGAVRMSLCYRGAVRRRGCTTRPPVGWSGPRRARWPRCTPAVSPRTTRRTSGTPPPTPPGTCWSGPGWTRPLIERFSARMADRGALYNVDEDVYFAKSADHGFGSLSGPGTACGYDQSRMAELAGQRGGDPDRPGKKDPLDVLLWRAERPGEPAWDSRFGRGRPGWHVECAAIATEYLGNSFDVQAGGSDLVFPHHEMSASHARVALSPADHTFARVYVHAGMVSYHGEKMSKSLGNLVFVNKLLADGVDPMAIRMALLAHHYRSDWEWTDAVLGDAQARLARWRSALARAEDAVPQAAVPQAAVPQAAVPQAAVPEAAVPEAGPPAAEAPAPASGAERLLAGVRARMRDDLDAPGALAVVDRWADTLLAEPPTRVTPGDLAGARLVQATVDALLGIRL